ncbi:MAG: FtsW/RodA/SpoVE family cell cycle protein [Actinomycetaceae bacterium]|nr:FtsW/RodA/SpoVE family cell cycle protein [Actinomycetaceae bacterium]
MNVLRRVTRAIPTVRFEAHANSPMAKHWHAYTTTPGFTFVLIRLLVVLLAFIGLIMVFSATTIMKLSAGSNPFLSFLKPTLLLVAGLVLMTLCSKARYQLFIGTAPLIFGISLALQGVVLFTGLGQGAGGNKNWISVAGFQAQPSELIKLGLILYIAWVVACQQIDVTKMRDLLKWVAPAALVALGLVLGGHDLGTALIFVLILATVLVYLGVPKRWLFLLGGLGVFCVGVAIGVSPSRRARVAAIFSSSKDELGIDLQQVRAAWGLGTGGLLGVGPGASRQKWNYLPEAHTDFIFAILGEEFGLIGTLAVLLLFVALAWGLYRLMVAATDPGAKVIAVGAMGWIIGQALINIAVVIGWGPVVGVPLPFVSSGGSSLLSTMTMMGIVLACARAEPGARERLAKPRRAIDRSIAFGRLRRKKASRG